jgi:hypothetical protein
MADSILDEGVRGGWLQKTRAVVYFIEEGEYVLFLGEGPKGWVMKGSGKYRPTCTFFSLMC